MSTAAPDFFDKARAWAAAVMIAAGVVTVIGSTLDWVTITMRPELQEGADFGDDTGLEEPRVTRPFTGLEARDGWWSLAGGLALLSSGVLLLVRKTSLWGWMGLLAAVVIGAIAVADYRGIGDLSSSFSRRMEVVGAAEPGPGITLVVAAALAGVVGSVAGVAASPRRATED